MKLAELLLYVGGLLAELYGVVGLVENRREARRLLSNPPEVVIDGGSPAGPGPGQLFAGEELALRALAVPRRAVIALLAGIVAGAAGNVLSLFPW